MVEKLGLRGFSNRESLEERFRNEEVEVKHATLTKALQNCGTRGR
jgi:hypothetical protein